MARNEIYVDAPPSAVFALLADPHRFADWVVGTKTIRAADGDWPRPGSFLHHEVGAGPVGVRDNTKVLECVPDRRLVLEARVRPYGVAEVRIELSPDDDGTTVVLHEYVIGPWLLRLASPLVDLTIKARNVESLRRLKELAEGDRAPSS